MVFHTHIYYFGNAFLTGLVCAGVGGTVASALRMQQWFHEQPNGPKSGTQKQKLKKTGNGGTSFKLKADYAAGDGPAPPPPPFTTSFDGGIQDGSERTVVSRVTVEIEDNASEHPYLIDLPDSIHKSVICVEATSGSSAFARIGTPWPSEPASSVPRGDAAANNTSATVLTLLFSNLTDHLYDLFAGHHEQQGGQDAFAHLGPDKRPPTTFRPIRGSKVPLCGVEGLVLLLNRTEMNVKGPRSVLAVGTVVPFFYALSPDSGAGSVELEHFAIDTIHAAEDDDDSDFELDPVVSENSGLSAKEVAAMLKRAELWGREGSGLLNMSSRTFGAAANCGMNWMGPLGTWDMTAATEVYVAVGGGCKLDSSSRRHRLCIAGPTTTSSCLTSFSDVTLSLFGQVAGNTIAVYKLSVPALNGGSSIWSTYGYPYLEVYTTGGSQLTTYAPWVPLTNQGILTTSPAGFANYRAGPSKSMLWSIFVPESIYTNTQCGWRPSVRITLVYASIVSSSADREATKWDVTFDCVAARGGRSCSILVDFSKVDGSWDIDVGGFPNTYYYLKADSPICKPDGSFTAIRSPQFYLDQETRVEVLGGTLNLLNAKFPIGGSCAVTPADMALRPFQSVACNARSKYPKQDYTMNAYAGVSARSSSNINEESPLSASMGVTRIYWDISKNFYLTLVANTSGTLRIVTKIDFDGSISFPIYPLTPIMNTEIDFDFPNVGTIKFSLDYRLGLSLAVSGKASVEGEYFIPLSYAAVAKYEPGVDLQYFVEVPHSDFTPNIAGLANLTIKPTASVRLMLTFVNYVSVTANFDITAILRASLAYPPLPALSPTLANSPHCHVAHNMEQWLETWVEYNLAASSIFMGFSGSESGLERLSGPHIICSPPNNRVHAVRNPYGLPTAGGATPLRVVAKYASSSPTPDERAETVLGLRLHLVSLLQRSLGDGTTTLMPSAIQMIPIENTLKRVQQQPSSRSFEAAAEGSTEDYYVYSFTTTVDSTSGVFPVTLERADGTTVGFDMGSMPPEEDESDGLSMGSIIGIIVGGVVALLTVVILVFLLVRQRSFSPPATVDKSYNSSLGHVHLAGDVELQSGLLKNESPVTRTRKTRADHDDML